MIDPGTAMLIATAVNAGVQGFTGSRANKLAKKKSKEMQRETHAELSEQAHNRAADLEEHRLGSQARRSKKKARNLAETTDLVRGAFKI